MIVSAVAPAVLGAVVHLAVLVGRPGPVPPDDDVARDAVEAGSLDENGLSQLWHDAPPVDRAAELIAAGAGRRRLSRELEITEYEARRLIERARTTPATNPSLNGALS